MRIPDRYVIEIVAVTLLFAIAVYLVPVLKMWRAANV